VVTRSHLELRSASDHQIERVHPEIAGERDVERSEPGWVIDALDGKPCAHCREVGQRRTRELCQRWFGDLPWRRAHFRRRLLQQKAQSIG
jgi:hypothetical protein